MIPFDEIDKRLSSLDKTRVWLAEVTPYSADYLRTVLAPNSTRRTPRVQQIISDAIEKEEARQREALGEPLKPTAAIVLPDRVTIKCQPEERRKWDAAARTQQQEMDDWIVSSLNHCADLHLLLPKAATSQQTDTETVAFELPMFGLAAAGSPVVSQLVGETVAVPRKFPEGYFVIEVNGNSMEPTLPDGCRIICEPREYSPKHGKVCIISDGHGASVKRYDGQRKSFVSDNPDFPEFTPAGDVKLQGYLVEILPG